MATLTEPNSFYKESVCNCLKNGFNAIISGKNCFAQNASALAHGAKNPAFTPTLPRLFVIATHILVVRKVAPLRIFIVANEITSFTTPSKTIFYMAGFHILFCHAEYKSREYDRAFPIHTDKNLRRASTKV